MQTTLHTYRYDLGDPAQKAEYEALKARLKAMGLRKLHMGGFTRSPYTVASLDGATVELDTAHLFDNQWNATLNGADVRLFDWFSDAAVTWGNSKMRAGHWLEQTDEMREVRRNTYACGYCGHQEAAQKGAVFCPKCIGSEYLKEDQLHLTRMRAVKVPSLGAGGKPRAPLTEAEAAHLLPLYREAQIHGHTERDKARIAKARQNIQARAAKAIADAKTERDGMLWLLDRGIRTHNVIFYPHKGRFQFGWREPYGETALAGLLEAMGGEFRWPYDIKCADGRTLSGEG